MTTQVTCHLSGFVYSSTDDSTAVAPPCPAGSAYNRLFWQCASLRAPVAVTVNCLVDRCGVPKLVATPTKKTTDAAATATTGTVSEKQLDTWVQELREVFAKLVNKKLLRLSLVDYDSFFEYYEATSAGDTAAAKRISDARGGKR